MAVTNRFVFTSAAAKESKQSVRKKYNNCYSKRCKTSQNNEPSPPLPQTLTKPSKYPPHPKLELPLPTAEREASEWVTRLPLHLSPFLPPPISLLRQLHPLTFTPVECVCVDQRLWGPMVKVGGGVKGWRRAGRRGGAGVGEFKRWRERGGGEKSLFLPTTKAVRGNNKHGEWCVSREALSRVSVWTGQREGIRKREIERKMEEGEDKW